nr:2-succinyl-5-enolpyruvyl-6-hydroxy-3-cyclohexene-1-carboxylic-acid synthase [Prochlorococcus sp. MIT 1300]
MARTNLFVSLRLLEALLLKGMNHVVLCPGSRSTPLALAVGRLAGEGKLALTTAIDERSAAFLALGIAAGSGTAPAVITTSGSAVANLLPAVVEADRSCQPLLLITADRPARLKNCGANQTVNQEQFLLPATRLFRQGPSAGIHLFTDDLLAFFVEEAWAGCHDFSGPVHLNLPIEEPLNVSANEQTQVLNGWVPENYRSNAKPQSVLKGKQGGISNDFPVLDPSRSGFIVVGPWRGKRKDLIAFQRAVHDWQKISGWPVLADPLSGISSNQKGLINNWELLLPNSLPMPQEEIQVLRLGPLSASRNLELLLNRARGGQVLISEGDARNLDPLNLAIQWSQGFTSWLECFKKKQNFQGNNAVNSETELCKQWLKITKTTQDWLDKHLPLEGMITEPSLARWIPRILPIDIPIMLAASSPVRDWLSFSGVSCLSRRCFGFRGASGIDGTLSLAMGLAKVLGRNFLVTGDIALLHDSNGWLFSSQNLIPLTVLLIDNGGGGIFHQLPLQVEPKESFDRLFAMPQNVDPLALAEAHGVPYRQISCLDDLAPSIEWSLSQSGPVLLRVCTSPSNDAFLRQELRSGLETCLKEFSKNNSVDI